eukprot:297228_1
MSTASNNNPQSKSKHRDNAWMQNNHRPKIKKKSLTKAYKKPTKNARRAIYGWSFILIVAEWFRVKKCLRDEYKRQKQLHKQNMIQYPKPSKSMYSIAAVRAKMNGHQLFEKYVCKSSMKAWYLFGIKLLLVNAARFNEINDKHKMKWHTVPQREQWKRALKESHDDWTIVHQHTREFEYSYPKAADAYVMIFGETPFAK